MQFYSGCCAVHNSSSDFHNKGEQRLLLGVKGYKSVHGRACRALCCLTIALSPAAVQQAEDGSSFSSLLGRHSSVCPLMAHGGGEARGKRLTATEVHVKQITSLPRGTSGKQSQNLLVGEKKLGAGQSSESVVEGGLSCCLLKRTARMSITDLSYAK